MRGRGPAVCDYAFVEDVLASPQDEGTGQTYFKPYWPGLYPSFEHASWSTSVKCLDGVVLIVARLAVASITTTWALMVALYVILEVGFEGSE